MQKVEAYNPPANALVRVPPERTSGGTNTLLYIGTRIRAPKFCEEEEEH
jgi:hypothetical protein